MYKKNRFFNKTYLQPWSIRLFIGGVCLVLFAIAAFSFYLAELENDFFLETLIQQGETIAHIVEAGHGKAPYLAKGTDPQSLLDQLIKSPEIAFIAITNLQGNITAQSTSEKIQLKNSFNLDEFKAHGPDALYAISRQPGWEGKLLQYGRIFSLPAPNPSPGQFDGSHNLTGASRLIFIGLPLKAMENAILKNNLQFLILIFLLILCGVGLSMLLNAKRGFHRSLHAFRDIKTFSSLLLARLPSGIVATGADGRVKVFNEAAVKMTGSLKGEIINRKAHKVLPALLRGFACRMQESDEIIDRELDFPAPEGIVPLHICSVPIRNIPGDTRGRVLLMHDLTEIKRLRHEVQRHERFVAMGKMAAGVAHEIRNPLNSIKGLTAMLGSDFEKGSKKWEVSRLLGQEVDRLNRNISDLLEYSKPLYLKLGKVDINALISDIILLMESEFSANEVTVNKDLHPDLPEITIDNDRIKQVLMNIFLNSIQAMAAGGALSIISRPSNQSGRVEILVRDTGCGIPEEDIDKIFDPYFTTKESGTGLGLAMAYKIIQGHGGKFHISSEDDIGSTVRLFLGGNPFTTKRNQRPEI